MRTWRNNQFFCILVVVGIVLLAAARAVEVDAAEYTIIAFGDSTTASDSDDPVTYADILRNELPRYDIAAIVSNKGVPANTTKHAVARFNKDVLAQNSDLVIIQFGLNDAAIDVWKDPPAKQSRVSLEQYTKNLKYFIEALRNHNRAVILMTPNPLRWTPELKGLYGKLPYDLDDPMGLNVKVVDYAQAARDIAAAEDVDLVDVYKLFVEYGNEPGQEIDDLLRDGVHPNGVGHRLIADALVKKIRHISRVPARRELKCSSD